MASLGKCPLGSPSHIKVELVVFFLGPVFTAAHYYQWFIHGFHINIQLILLLTPGFIYLAYCFMKCKPLLLANNVIQTILEAKNNTPPPWKGSHI